MHEDNPSITSVCFAPNGRYVLAFSSDSCLRLWDYVSGTVKKTYQGHENSKFSIGGCFGILKNDDDDDSSNSNSNGDNNYSNNTNGGASGGGGEAFIAAASEDGDIVLWDVKTKEVVQRIRGAHDGVCFWVDVHGDTLVSAGQDGKIKIFRHQRPHAVTKALRPAPPLTKDESITNNDNNTTNHADGGGQAAATTNGDVTMTDGHEDGRGEGITTNGIAADEEKAGEGALLLGNGELGLAVGGALRDGTTPLKDEDIKKEE